MTKNYQRSFLKWPGNKHTLLKRLFRHIPRSGHTLVDAFAGSCTFALNTDYKHYIINDMNADLINMFKFIVAAPEQFLTDAREMFDSKNNNADTYYEFRAKYNASSEPYERALLLLYLNKHGYNGLVRYNKSGGYNVPFGKFKNPFLNEEGILHFAAKFENATFLCGDFDKALEHSKNENTVAYCDPPYLPLTKTSDFVGYTGGGFTLLDQKRLNDLAKVCKNSGAKIFVSNHNVPLTHKTYSDAEKSVNFLVQRSIAANAKRRKRAKETLLIY